MGERRHIDAAVIVPAGPRDDVVDTVRSVLCHATCPQVVVVIDDTRGQQDLRSLASEPGVHIIPAPAARSGTTGGLWVKVGFGYRWLFERYRPDVVLRLDADALVIGPGLVSRATATFRDDPGIGLLGAYRLGPDGGLRDFGWLARQVRRECGLPGRLARPAVRRALLPIVAAARSNGWAAGGHVLGCVCLSPGPVLEEIGRRGWFDLPDLEASRLFDDHLLSLCTVAAGYRLEDFNGPDDPIAVQWKGLPMSPDELLNRGKLATHSVRSWADLGETEIRAAFRQRRPSRVTAAAGVRWPTG